MSVEQATLGGGCFWCLEACYQQLKGVSKVESGYAAGDVKNPTYKMVCTGNTGHAEVVQVTFDPSVISFKDLLNVFFTIHDPTTKDRQGNDVGTQYRSIILYHSEEQKAAAQEVMAQVASEGWYPSPLVTQLEQYDPTNYYGAEDYHQNYFNENPTQGYCRAVVHPKVQKFRSKFIKQLAKI